ncbi:MerR family transcriptional regulator [Marinitenerispora sediminis]|uniref:MerR family transcriptional regulator n=2 Tax=Marinitenerispora sediminis TaxID=1931232 RepID=A0A368SYU0_9ACTN|nr:MerR family transcriptional regulator [Marinitenerispora sediminis]RCV48000.1 MerR family transcriptional regulator [Marinitenerispora sediminis]RCV49646.1 MerR family transcriptional regulator [Marinitenerispora sediminis]
MRIGELAAAAGTTPRAVRHYEQAGLLESERAPNGYRRYPPRALNRVRSIRFLVRAGLTLDDVRHFLPCLDGDVAAAPPAPDKLAVARARLAALDARIAAQTEVRDRLAAALSSADPPAGEDGADRDGGRRGGARRPS